MTATVIVRGGAAVKAEKRDAEPDYGSISAIVAMASSTLSAQCFYALGQAVQSKAHTSDLVAPSLDGRIK